MRVLITLLPGVGYFNSTLPLARSLVAAGHTVQVVTGRTFAGYVGAAGLEAVPIGFDWQDARLDIVPGDDGAGRGAPSGGGLPAMSRRATARLLPRLLAFIDDWLPDVIVHSPFEFYAYMAGAVRDVPRAVVGTGLIGSGSQMATVAGLSLVELQQKYGLTPDPELMGMYRYLYLCRAPKSYRLDQLGLRVIHELRPDVDDRAGQDHLPAWVDGAARPIVMVTLGTVFNQAPTTLEMVLAAMATLPVDVAVGLGFGQNAAGLKVTADNVHLEPYIPLTLLLPRAQAVVCHAGFNTVMTTLQSGLPLVLLPQAADQPYHAQRCAELGAGIQIRPDDATRERVQSAVRAVLEEPNYRAEARQLQAEIAAMSGPERAVELLERLARERAPLESETG